MANIPLIPLIIGELTEGCNFSYCESQSIPRDDKEDDSKLSKKQEAIVALIVVLWSLACMVVGFLVGLNISMM